jgi:hypothetical protein
MIGETQPERQAIMAGNHEQARGEGARADGVAARGGEFVDSDIPGEERVRTHEPAGEFIQSDVPGQSDAEPRQGENAYDASDIPGEATPQQDGEVGHFTDSDIPSNSTRDDVSSDDTEAG